MEKRLNESQREIPNGQTEDLAMGQPNRNYFGDLLRLEIIADSDHAFGADLRDQAYGSITDPRMRLWLRQSDELVDKLRGPKRLKKRRRRGILRHLQGSDLGLPFFLPSLEPYCNRDAPDPRIYALRDELEYVVIPGKGAGNEWRPVKQELSFDEARAIVGMKASTLYSHTWRGKVPGQLCRPLGDDYDRNLHELRFKTEAFMNWAMDVSRSGM